MVRSHRGLSSPLRRGAAKRRGGLSPETSAKGVLSRVTSNPLVIAKERETLKTLAYDCGNPVIICLRAFARSAFLFTWAPWSSHGVTKGTKWIITHSLTTPSQPPTRHVARGPGAVGIGCWLLVIYHPSPRLRVMNHPVTLTRATPPLDEELCFATV